MLLLYSTFSNFAKWKSKNENPKSKNAKLILFSEKETTIKHRKTNHPIELNDDYDDHDGEDDDDDDDDDHADDDDDDNDDDDGDHNGWRW